MESIEKSVDKFFDYFGEAIEKYKDLESIGEMNIIGMGGSGVVGKILRSFADVEVVSCFYDPKKKLKYKNNVLISYSGNTKETLSWVNKGEVAICSGGKLYEEAKKRGWKLITIPKDLQPRASFPYMLVIVAKLYSDELYNKIVRDFEEAYKKKEVLDRRANEIANELSKGKEILIIGDCETEGICYRAKTQINENSKKSVILSTLPEAFHNEVEGIPNLEGKVFLLSKSFEWREVFEDLFKDKVIAEEYRGNLVESIYLVDKISIELGKIRKVGDMTSVEVIKKIKNLLYK